MGPAINSNLITGSIVSDKGNTGGSGRKYSGVLPPTKKLKSDSSVLLISFQEGYYGVFTSGSTDNNTEKD